MEAVGVQHFKVSTSAVTDTPLSVSVLTDTCLLYTSFTDDFSIGTLTDNKQTKIKKGQYLVLNDNRRDTEDSRKFGLIEKDQIKGVISFRVYPLSRFGFVDVD